MNILIRYSGNAHRTIRQSLANALAYSGHSVVFWQADKQPIFDVFDRFKPDLFITETYTFDRAQAKIIEQNPDCLVTMVGSDWGRDSDIMDLNKFQVLVAQEKEIRAIDELKKRTGKPDLIHGHYTLNHMDRTHCHWRDKLGIPLVSMALCCDIVEFLNTGEVKPEFVCDGSIVGGMWPYKNQNLSKYITPLCYPVGEFNIKIWGHSWPTYNFMGFLPDGVEPDVFASSKICLNTHEPHSTELIYGNDFNERIVKCAGSGRFVLEGGYVRTIHEDLFPNKEIEFAETTEEYRDKFKFYLKNEELREKMARAAQKVCIKNHTNFDRVAGYLEALGLDGHAQSVRTNKKKLLLERKYE